MHSSLKTVYTQLWPSSGFYDRECKASASVPLKIVNGVLRKALVSTGSADRKNTNICEKMISWPHCGYLMTSADLPRACGFT